MTWEEDGSSLEIRTQGQLADGRPALDEIVAGGASVHLEQMAHDHWWMGLEAGGKYFPLNFGVQGGRLWVRLSDQGDESAEWEGDSRERPLPETGDRRDVFDTSRPLDPASKYCPDNQMTLVSRAGLEPATLCLKGTCSTT
jgi:hypothetical protein